MVAISVAQTVPGRPGSLTVPHWVWTLVDVPPVTATITAAVRTGNVPAAPPPQAASRVEASAMAVRQHTGPFLKESAAVICALLDG
jgi:hypothetical protein